MRNSMGRRIYWYSMWKNTIAFANAKDIWKILFHPSRFLKKITTTAIESVTLSVDVNFYWKIWKNEFFHFLKLLTFIWIFLKKGHICGIFVEKLRFFPSMKIYSSKKQEFVRSFSFIEWAECRFWFSGWKSSLEGDCEASICS